jgi:hypothetical protein
MCAVKLDMHKAYDRVEWGFLRDMMLRLGFNLEWVNMIMACVTSVNYRIWFNSEETEVFTPTRGIRQGDPLSPYLFLICAEGLSSLLEYEELNGGIQGVKVCRGEPSVSHLLFADDSLILMTTDMSNATSLRNALDMYCANSGQLVSVAKSSIFFSPNTDVQVRAEVCAHLNILVESLTDKYLGLPSLVGIDRSDCFQHLIERICQRINGWNEKLLSIGGKEILLKAIAQAIPAYAMSVFNIPKNICKAICNAIAKFWWGGSSTQRKMHWMAWWKMCIPKNEGGMGFRDLHCFNQAMLAKQCWRLLSDPDSLCAQILRAKYYRDGKILRAGPTKGASFTWQSIVTCLQTFKRGQIWRVVGDGSDINIWEDHSDPDQLYTESYGC